MSDVPADHDHHPHHGGGRVKWFPLVLCLGMVAFTVFVVALGQATGVGTYKTGASRFAVLGTVDVDRLADGTIEVRMSSTKDVVASYSPGRQQFLAGALRSLNRMRGAPADAAGRTYDVLRVGGGAVFLEDVETGDRISLNAFNRATSIALATSVAAANGGEQ